MKFNKSFLIMQIYIIGISTIIFSCSSFKNITNNHKKDVNIDFFKHMKNKDDYQIINKAIQSKINNLKNINIIYFPLNQYSILPDFFSILNIHADFLRNNPLYHIKIEGHTDERGTPEYNIALGERRAYSVKTYLQSRGVLSGQMQTVSYGKEKPVSFSHSEEAYSKNRRVVLSY